jgi:carotenoid cleavage dioxygenase
VAPPPSVYFGSGEVLSEFAFQPSSADAAEDDGVLMGYVYDAVSDRSELTILDAQTLEDIASIKLPHRVPGGFHGNWVPAMNPRPGDPAS